MTTPMSSPAGPRLAARIHRLLLSLWPHGFRRRYGAEAEAAFEQLARERHLRGGVPALALLVLATGWDTLSTAARERRRERLTTPRPRAPEEALTVRSLVQDTWLTLRMLAARPAFTAVALLTLALGIGANTAIFSVIHGVLLRPLPFPAPEQLVRLYPARAEAESGVPAGAEARRAAFSLPDFRDWRREAATIQEMGLYSSLPSGPLFTGGAEPLEVPTTYVTAGFFETLGRAPHLGRFPTSEEEEGDNRAAVLSYGFWQGTFGGDPAVVGSTVELDDEPYRVVGVMPQDFAFPDRETQLWAFLSLIPPQSIPLELRQVRFLEAVARLAPGADLGRAREELSGIARALETANPETNAGLTAAEVEPLAASVTGAVSQPLLLLLGTSGLILLLASANVAHLLLARGVERRREMAVRAALGAGRGRLLRQLLTEAVVLSVLGGAAGVALAFAAVPALLAASARVLPRAAEVAVDGRVLAFAAGTTLLTGMLFGLLPALKLTRRRAGLLAAGTRSPSASGRRLNLLIVAEAAGALLLVIGAALLGRSLWSLERVDPGFDAEHLLAVVLTINDARYPERPQYLDAYGRLLESLGNAPGVEAVGSIRRMPMRAEPESLGFTIPGRPEPQAAERPSGHLQQVSPGFFRAAGVPLLAGRDFGPEDRSGAPYVVVINDALRRRHWPAEEPRDVVGREILSIGETIRIVGVVGDVKQSGPDRDAPPALYAAQAQIPRRGMTFLLRTRGNPLDLVRAAQEAVWRVDPDQPIEEIASLGQVLAGATARTRLVTLLLGGFAVLALVLAAVGIYGVLAHSVGRRTHEIGVRVALGARRSTVLRMIVLQGMMPVLAGMGAGVVVALLLSDALEGLVFGVAPIDPPTYLAVALFFAAVAFIACYLPGRKALGIDPVRALREE